jgi:hypothetical protein
MTPANVTAEQYEQIRQALIWFWAFLGLVVAFAANLLVAYAIIPSLISTRDLPTRVGAIRPVLFALAAIFLLAALYAFVNIVNGVQVLYEIWPHRWI